MIFEHDEFRTHWSDAVSVFLWLLCLPLLMAGFVLWEAWAGFRRLCGDGRWD